MLNRFVFLVLAWACLCGTCFAQAFDRAYTEPINGTRLHFRVRGSDPKNPYLLILHGGPGFSAAMFYPWGASLEKSLNVVYLDQRGSGQSDPIKVKNAFAPTPDEVKDYTVPTLLKDIEQVRQFLKVDRWYVLGHSWGGMLGLEYVTAYPGPIQGYLHVDGLLSQPRAQDAILAFTERQIASDAAGTETVKQARAKRLGAVFPGAKTLPPGRQRLFSTMQFAFALLSEMYYANPEKAGAYNARIAQAAKEYKIPAQALAMRNTPAIALMQTEQYATRDVSGLLPEVRCRTLVINGRQDGLIPVETARIVQKGIPGATLLVLEDCGHFPFAEQPEKFTSAVVDFVRR